MKPFFLTAIIALFLLFIFGFALEKGDQLTQKQKDKIMKEIIAVDDSIMASLERMDVERALQFYSPNFVAFGAGGERTDFQGLKKEYANLYSSAISYKWTPYSLDFLIITNDKVVITQDGKNEMIMKSGSKLIFDPSHYTFAFEKIEGKWKLFYHHFSGTYVK